MTKVRRYWKTEEINNWRFDSKEEAEKYIDERLSNRTEGCGEGIIFTREEA